MTVLTKPSMAHGVWADRGETVTPSNAKIATGWVVEIPPHQIFNWWMKRADAFLAHNNQRGVPAWDATTQYYSNVSYVTGPENGLVYRAITTNTGVNPETDTSGNWRVAFEAAGNSLLKAQNLADVPNKALARQNLGISTTSDYDVRYLQRSQNLADVPNKATARANLGLGDSATRNVGTVGNTVAAGDDARIVNAVPKSTTVVAGNGLTGGGSLNGNVTIALGTPLHISGTSGNTVTAAGHTHAVDVASLHASVNPTAWTRPSRSKGVTYYAPPNKWIMVSVTSDTDGNGNSILQGVVNGVVVSSQRVSYDHAATNSISFIVPAGAAYYVDCSRNITLWAELR